MGRGAGDKAKIAGNQSDFSCWGRRKSRKTVAAAIGGHEAFLIGDLRWRRLVCDKGQPEVVDDAIHHTIVAEESEDLSKMGVFAWKEW